MIEHSNPDIDVRFTYHKPKDGQAERYEAMREYAKKFAYLIDENCPTSREKYVALNKLDEVVMWANASIARNE